MKYIYLYITQKILLFLLWQEDQSMAWNLQSNPGGVAQTWHTDTGQRPKILMSNIGWPTWQCTEPWYTRSHCTTGLLSNMFYSHHQFLLFIRQNKSQFLCHFSRIVSQSSNFYVSQVAWSKCLRIIGLHLGRLNSCCRPIFEFG